MNRIFKNMISLQMKESNRFFISKQNEIENIFFPKKKVQRLPNFENRNEETGQSQSISKK